MGKKERLSKKGEIYFMSMQLFILNFVLFSVYKCCSVITFPKPFYVTPLNPFKVN